MITPFLFVKQRLGQLFGETNEARVWLGIRESLKMLDDAIDQQEEEDRTHRKEVEALLGTYDPVRRRREKKCAGS